MNVQEVKTRMLATYSNAIKRLHEKGDVHSNGRLKNK